MIDWVYTPEKPYPETLETVVNVRFADGEEVEGYAVGFWHGPHRDFSNWYCGAPDEMIVAYGVVK